ncbi:hypothetical protein AUEXF2481DRAFT_657041 [Aureobasidium subglaciale EXF-2481]|uniref:Uncharacterized protein n=1 Tax=Aureobasidium subglaciale (strain EXF-2481) TaxID=1043005 RepID=A0A074ZBA5_AURSE|nr:uncharacterized protein AUEXF2481DRAFT_657041 [Aureobasidium subglaciale EXF-2481]KEQ96016.1 hypothetical protein AUEXF2481DRAFT_657041 [Aureobasidium subglaciale EXF-2481]
MPIMQNAQPFFHHVAFYLRECSLRPSISLINTRAFSACPIWKEAQEDPDLQRQHRLEQRAARKRHLYATSRAVREQSQLARHKHHMMRYRADPDYRVTKRANESVPEVHTLVTPPNTALPLAKYQIREPHDLDLAFSKYERTQRARQSSAAVRMRSASRQLKRHRASRA